MIDIISSSIRFGKSLREHEELKSLYIFFSDIVNNKSNPDAVEYRNLLSKYFSQYGFYSFNIVDEIIEQNLNSENAIAKGIVLGIKSFLLSKANYYDILNQSKKYGEILNTYIAQLMSQINDYPQIDLQNVSLKIKQCSNELSTAVLRSGVFSWLSNPQRVLLLQKEMNFVSEYETRTAEFGNLHPYNKNVVNIINSYCGNRKKIAQDIENIRFVKYLVGIGIIQGFFFELFEIPTTHIIKFKEIFINKSIHPVFIKTDLGYPSNHLFLFTYKWNEKVSYLLTKRMSIHFSHEENFTTLYGYCYPTNEFSLLKID